MDQITKSETAYETELALRLFSTVWEQQRSMVLINLLNLRLTLQKLTRIS